MRLLLLILCLTAIYIHGSVLVVLPVSEIESLERGLLGLQSKDPYLSIDVLACNENDLYPLEAHFVIENRYYSRLLCESLVNTLTTYMNYTDLLESLRFDLIRATVNIQNDFDVFLWAVSHSTLVIYDSMVVNDDFMKVVDTILGSTTNRFEVTLDFANTSTLKVWRHIPRPKYLSMISIDEDLPAADIVTRNVNDEFLCGVAANASTHWNAGLFPDRNCNCGRWRYKDKAPCYDLNSDTQMNLERFKIHPKVEEVDSLVDGSALNVKPSYKKKLLLCMVYTISPRHHNLRAIVETWGKRCDGFIAWSNETDTSISAVHIYNPRLNGVESYDVMWYKTMAIWQAVAMTQLVEEYEYFYLCGDDVYVIVNNLRHYLTSDFLVRRSQGGRLPVYLGRRTPHNHYLEYATGESGYVLNARAVKLLVQHLNTRECFDDVKVSMEDIMIGNCLLNALGVRVIDTRDSKGNERFLTHNLTTLFHDGFLVNRYEGHLKNMKVGLDGYSEYSIAFHLMTPNDYMYCVDGYFQSVTPN